MIKKLKIKFIAVAMASIAALLIVILATINIVNFTMVTEDADKLLDMMTNASGDFPVLPTSGGFPAPPEGEEGFQPPQGEGFQPPQGEGNDPPQGGDSGQSPDGGGFQPPEGGFFGPMGQLGPDSPDTQASSRFFTVAFDAEGQARVVVFNMSATDEAGAVEWATSLKNKKGGWTNTSYRFRTYEAGGETYVTVIDQGREILPTLHVFWASIIGSAAGLAVAFVVLLLLAGRFVSPIAKSDEKQKKFIAQAARELKTPLTVLAIDKERIKEDFGESDVTRSVDKQVDKMFDLANGLNELIIFEQADAELTQTDLSELTEKAFTAFTETFAKRNISLDKSIKEGVSYKGDRLMLEKMVYEIADNASTFAKTFVKVKLDEASGRITLRVENDADGLETGDLDTVFERFNKSDSSTGKGLGLSMVKAVVEAHKGRVRAYSRDGNFIIKVELNF